MKEKVLSKYLLGIGADSDQIKHKTGMGFQVDQIDSQIDKYMDSQIANRQWLDR